MQTAADLRTLVIRRAGLGRRVALLSSDELLAQGLEKNGCTVLSDPDSLDALTDFGPEVVVAFDGLVAEGLGALEGVARAAPAAELLFSFANAASASLLSRALQGKTSVRALAEAEVRAALSSAGYVVTGRDVVVTPHQPSRLAVEVDAALRQLFEQLNPDAAADRFLLSARRGVVASSPDRTPGLVSVIVTAGPEPRREAAGAGPGPGEVPTGGAPFGEGGAANSSAVSGPARGRGAPSRGGGDASSPAHRGLELDALTGTLSSLAGQAHRALEVLVASPFTAEEVEQAGRALKSRAGTTLLPVSSAAQDPAARINAGLALARGQYVSFLEAGELLDARHLSSLLERLSAGTEAWALATPRASLAPPFDVLAWCRAGAAHRGLWLVDRDRLGAFPLTFAEGTPHFELLLFLRLAALFPPAWKPSAPTLDSPRAASADVEGLLHAMQGRPLQALVPLARLLRAPPPPKVEDVVRDALEERSPMVARAFSRAAALVERVRDAAVRAGAQARRERGEGE
ncbi:MAG: glycosyltransferase family A protein [Myxococcota bacterium]